MNKTAIEMSKIKSNEEIANKDRDQREKESKRDFTGKIIGSAIGGLTGFGSGLLSKAGRIGAAKIGAAVKKAAQDATWYKQYLQNSDKFVNLPTFTRVGDKLKRYMAYSGTTDLAIPGICVFEYAHTLGFTDGDKGNPANKSFTRTLTELRKANSRIGNYDPSDIGMYVNVVGDLISNIEEAKRATRLLNTFDPLNRYINKDLIRALGFNPDQALNDKAQINMELEVLISDFNKNIPVPKGMTLFARKSFLGCNIFKDAKVSKSQYYAYRNQYVTVWDDVNNEIKFINKDNNLAGLSDLLTFIKKLQQIIADLQDTTTMVALLSDMRTGMPSGSFLEIEHVSMDSVFYFAESDEVLGQINNLYTIPDFLDTNLIDSALTIKVNANGLIYQGNYRPGWNLESGLQLYIRDNKTIDYTIHGDRSIYDGIYLNSYSDTVTGDDILVNTRNIPVIHTPLTPTGSDNYRLCTVRCSGTELFLRAKIYVHDHKSNLLVPITYHTYMEMETAVVSAMIRTSLWSTFDWVPKIQYYEYTEDSNGDITLKDDINGAIFTLFEYANWYPISVENLTEIHSLCISSLYYIDSTSFTRSILVLG